MISILQLHCNSDSKTSNYFNGLQEIPLLSKQQQALEEKKKRVCCRTYQQKDVSMLCE